MKKCNKDRILLIQGHFYIFQATGVYYIADLSEDFDVDIIVPSEYKEIEKFHYLIKDLNINNIYYVKGFVYFDSTSSIFDMIKSFFLRLNPVRYIRFYFLFSEICKNKYYALFSHDYMQYEMLYLFTIFRRHNKKSKIFSITSSQPSNENIPKMFRSFKEINAAKLSLNIPVLKPVVKVGLYLVKYVESIFINYIYPIAIMRVAPIFKLNAQSNVDSVPPRGFYDKHIVYEDIEEDFYRGLFGGNVDVVKCAHPVVTGRHLVDQFCGVFPEPVDVVILLSTIGLSDGWLTYELDLWKSLIHRLQKDCGLNRVVVKLHPRMETLLCQQISESIAGEFENDVTVLTGWEISAETLIVKSSIIIGDVSSALIWAQYFHEKTVVSVTHDGYSNNADMLRYKNIICVSDVEQVLECINAGGSDARAPEPSALPGVKDIAKVVGRSSVSSGGSGRLS